jgi:hypothetical protein
MCCHLTAIRSTRPVAEARYGATGNIDLNISIITQLTVK